jgi:hypothetical protein
MSKISALNHYFIGVQFLSAGKGQNCLFSVSFSSLVVITMAAAGAAPMSSHYDTDTAHAKREEGSI